MFIEGGGGRGFGRPPPHTHTHTRDGLNYAQVKKAPPQRISVKLLQNKSVKLAILVLKNNNNKVPFFARQLFSGYWGVPLHRRLVRPPVENPDYGLRVHILQNRGVRHDILTHM